MEHCPECNAQNLSAQAKCCPNCGADLSPATEPTRDVETDDDLEFVVTEAHGQDPEFVGDAGLATPGESLDVKSTSDLVEDEAQVHSTEARSSHSGDAAPEDLSPIGRTDAPLPPAIEDLAADGGRSSIGASFRSSGAYRRLPLTPTPPPADKTSPADDEGQYLSDREKEEIIRKISAGTTAGADRAEPTADRPAASVQPAEPELSTPGMAERGRGIAYFYRNYIQIAGRQQLHDEDELQLDGRWYRLKPKKVRPGFLIGAGGIMFAAMLFIIASLLVSDGGAGDGEVIGMALDENGRPYLHGAIVRFPDLGVAVKSNPQGFFRSGQIPSGTHKMVYKVDGKQIAEDFITVASGEISTVSLTPRPPEEYSSSDREAALAAAVSENETKPSTPESAGDKSAATSKKKTDSRYAKLTLDANVDGARLSLDGSVMGAGNVTYSRLTPGKHEYFVEADGYQPVKGIVELQAGEGRRLEIELSPMAAAQKETVYSPEDYYYSGVANVKAGQKEIAVSDFSKAIEQKPSYAEAYLARADVYNLTKDLPAAHDDYIRAAEIFRINKDFNGAITAYNSAIEVNKKSLTAYLGRGDLYLAKGEEIAAIADYEAAANIDKKTAVAQFGLGKARFQLGHYDKAIKHFKDVRKLDDRNPVLYQYLMLAYLAVDDIKEVKKSFERFSEVASEADMQRMVADQKYSAILRVVDKN